MALFVLVRLLEVLLLLVLLMMLLIGGIEIRGGFFIIFFILSWFLREFMSKRGRDGALCVC